MKVLHLTLKKKWFDMILSGEKTEEYREIKPYWHKRLKAKDWDVIEFRNGYGKHVPSFRAYFDGLSIGHGKPSWGATLRESYFIIRIGPIISTTPGRVKNE